MTIENSDQEVIHQAIEWLDQGRKVELITVARTWGSSPRPPGSLAAVRDDGHLVGSVSGGCIEKQLAIRIDTDDRARTFAHEISNEEARKFGLPCGGQLELVFEALNDAEDLRNITSMVADRKRVARTVSLESGQTKLQQVDRHTEFLFDGDQLRKVCLLYTSPSPRD